MPNLNLPTFSTLNAENLKISVEADLQAGNDFLDALQNRTSKPSSADEALADIIKLETLDNQIERSWGLLSHLNSVMSSDAIREAHHAVLPLLSAYGTRQGQHQQLFACYQLLKNSHQFSDFSNARQRSIILAIQGFELSGVGLPDTEKQQFADINSQLSSLSAKFADNVLDATQAYKRILTKDELAAITETGLAMLTSAGDAYIEKQDIEKQDKDNTDNTAVIEKQKIDGKLYVATLDIPVYIAIMTHAENRQLRQEIYQAFCTRASNQAQVINTEKNHDNASIMADILSLRQQKTDLLSSPQQPLNSYADISLARKMADSPQQVFDFLYDLADRAKVPAKKDLAQLQQEAKDHPEYGIDDIAIWDTAFLAEKVRKQQFNLSQEALRPYFPVPKVLEGLFQIVHQLYDIHIKQKTVDVWHQDVLFYEIYDADVLIGAFYFDLYARTGKRGGAWMNGFQSKRETADNQQLPVAFMVCNFTPPQNDKPAQLTHDEVITLFHEFGHGLHHMLTKVTVPSVAGVNGVEWDAVELPSQFMEFWAWEAEGIALISQHIDTAKPLPQSMLDAMLSARYFQSGMMALRQLEFALFDLSIHAQSYDQQTPASADSIQQTLDKVRQDVALLIPPDYNRFQNAFSHIFAGGYAAGYYSYKWAELLASDAFDRFEEEGIFNKATGADFKRHVLEMGGSQPASENFKNFRKRPPQLDALLRHSGW